jgi:iron complex outermembrane receptor protein
MHRSHLTAGSLLALGMALASTPALAQSTGSVDFEQQTIVVSGRTTKSVNGVQLPDTPKAKQVLDQTIIAHQAPGQSINDIINLVPGVSFQNNDPFGSSGGVLYIRGFDNTRISQTFDGIPLNDTGGYAIYSNQQLDPEVIDQVNVNLGTTDVDSPTAAASGSTVNYRSRNPTEDFHARMIGSAGEYGYMRIFGEVDTGNLTAGGLRAYVTASNSRNDTIYGGIGKIQKQQYNAKLYQPLGSNGDFISIAGHYNRNRNNAFGSVPMWIENTGTRVVGTGSGNRYPVTGDDRFYQTARCVHRAGGRRGRRGAYVRFGLRLSHQPVRHGQHPHFLALYPGRRAGADGRSVDPVDQRQWRHAGLYGQRKDHHDQWRVGPDRL